MKKIKKLIYATAIFALSANATGVRPTTLVIDKNYQATQVVINNTDKRPTMFQVQVFKWTQNPDGTRNMIKYDKPNLIVSPKILKIKPGERRKVRIAKFVASDNPEAFRVLISEVPSREKIASAKIKATVVSTRAFNLPLFINQKRYSSVNLESIYRGKVRLRNNNPGYVKIRSVTYTDDLGHRAYSKGLKYILSGNTSDFELPKTFRPTRMRIDYADNKTQTIPLVK